MFVIYPAFYFQNTFNYNISVCIAQIKNYIKENTGHIKRLENELREQRKEINDLQQELALIKKGMNDNA